MHMQAKVGLVTTMSLDTTWPDEVVSQVEGFHAQARLALESLNFNVIVATDGLSRTKADMLQHGEELRRRGIEVLVVYVGTWTYSNMTVELAAQVGVPLVVWTYSGPGNLGIVGGAIARGALDEVGHMTTLVYGDFDDEAALTQLKNWCTGCAAFTRLKGQTLGIGGSRCMGMYTSHVDPSEIKQKFGVDIDGWEQAAFLDRARAVPDKDAAEFLKWMRREFGAIEAKDEVMLAQIKMYLALRNLIREQGYDFIAVKCLPELPSIHTTFCLAHALLNDTSDAAGTKEPFVCACESDSNGALTMQILKHVSGKPVLFADFLGYVQDENQVTLCNCGSQPTDFAPSRKEVHWVSEGLLEFEWKIGGCCPQYVARPGKVTLARLGRINGEYIMLIMTGQALTYPREKLAEVNPQQPQAYIKLDCRPENFIAELRCNHIHVVYGDYRETLKVFCRAAGVRAIVPV
jgi:L-fucose isomerase